jgi:hypothetical protein
MCSYIFIAVDPEDDFTFSASDEEDDTQLARAIADDMGYVLNTLCVYRNSLLFRPESTLFYGNAGQDLAVG